MAPTELRLLASTRGIALVAVLLAISLFSALGLALSLSSAVDRMAATNHEQAVDLLNMAEAALELAARDLGAAPDWNGVLAGTAFATLVDGPPSGTRRLDSGGVIDLTGLTNDATCGRASGCTDVTRMAATADRPWGTNNPWWRPFLYGPLGAASHPRRSSPVYVIVWIGDDGSEVDGNPVADGGGPEEEGRYIVRARAMAFETDRVYRAIEAELVRLCTPSAAGETCLPGSRVQSWRILAAAP